MGIVWGKFRGLVSAEARRAARQPRALDAAKAMLAGAAFLRGVIAAFPYRLHTILTDNGIAFTGQPRNRSGPTAQYRLHVFDRLWREHGIEHRLTKPTIP